ncbi:uncharacterized protein [Triticum aestivum]|uniref:uncharacterized protein n=1 Tax=Triticum aestivum TaxID=4565 RepID=UPI001D01CDDF|nr:uncharacterized protein LOC123191516 [Triticum aestivum]
MLRHTRHDGTCSLLQQAAIDDGGDGGNIGSGTPVNDDGGARGGVEATIADGEDGGISGIRGAIDDNDGLRPCSAILRGAERAEQRLINSADYNWIAAPLRHGAAERRESERGLSNGIGADKISIMRYLPESTIRTIENDQMCLYWRLCGAQRHFAYRKLLLKLDFIQPDSDREDVLEKLKSLTRWPGLKDYCELTSCLKSHMQFLQKHEQSKTNTASGTSEYESAALEKINSELSTTLQKHLDRYDWMLMEQYYDRVKLRRLARECATQAQTIGVILVGEALPINPEDSAFPLIKRIQGKFRSGAAAGRPLRLLALGVFAVVAAAGSLSSNVPLG